METKKKKPIQLRTLMNVFRARCPACGKLSLPVIGLHDPPPPFSPVSGRTPILGRPEKATCSDCGAEVVEQRMMKREWVVDRSPRPAKQ